MHKRVLLGLCLLPSVAMAKDTIWLNNGDRVVGEIVYKSDDRIAVDTDYAGRINVDWKHVATLETSKPITVVIKGIEGETTAALDVSQDGTVICKKCPRPIIELGDIDTLVYPMAGTTSLRSEGHIDLNADFERKGNNIDDYNLDAEIRVFHGRWRHILGGEKERKSDDDTVSTNRWNAKYEIDRFFGEHFYMRTTAEYAKDHEDQRFRARTYGAGPGYLFWDDKLSRLDISTSYVRVNYWYFSSLSDEVARFGFNAWLAAWDFKYELFGGRVDFYSNGDVAVPDVDFIDVIIESETGFRYKISHWLSANVSYEVDDVKSDPGDYRYYQTKVGLGAIW